MKRIAVLGSGIVGTTLAAGFKKHGYEVRIGSRSPEKLASFSAESGIEAGASEEICAWAEGIVLAVKARAAAGVLRACEPSSLSGKIIIDVTNPIADEEPVDGVLRYFTKANESFMEQLQAEFSDARFVKAFNSVSNARMVDPQLSGGKPTMFFCGNDEEAKSTVAGILEEFGWEPADMGSAVAAGPIESLAQLYCISGFRDDSWTHAFRVLWS